MGRALRIIDPAAAYHVWSRGSNRERIVWDDADCVSFRRELARIASRYRWRVLAWCLMYNHYHVILRTPDGGFSSGFQQLNGNHSRRTNERHGRSDHLFRNRPKSAELSSPAYFVSAILYTFRNPVDAGASPRAEDWPYSSFRATMGLERAPSWLAVDEVLALFGPSPAAARQLLADLVHSGRLGVRHS
jgi:putative transposase